MEPFDIIISEENRIIDFIIDPEDAYLAIRVTGAASSTTEKVKRLFASFKISTKKNNELVRETTFDINNQEPFPFDQINRLIPKVDTPAFERVTIEMLPGNTYEGFCATFRVTQGREKIEMHSPLEAFDYFFSNRKNTKILFSAPFGSGKSTFLDYYFHSGNSKTYNVFTLYPVNYSVASNEDIFKFIKADILLQLLATEVVFDKESIGFIRATEEYIYLKPEKAIFSFLDKVSLIHPKTQLLSKALKQLNLLVKEIKEYQKEQAIDDKDKAIQYIRQIYDTEGSLFEDNFFTQLIRQLLEQLKATTNKQNVLIIEDLDRMDPDHIFRILNVISAHYDTYKFSDDEVFPNKFGFDKIILVCDLKNIQSIFHHKYGQNTEFRGYIDKYFSSKPFEFSNLKNIKQYLEQAVESIHTKEYKDPRIDAFGVLLKLLLESNQLTLREMLKLMNEDFTDYNVTYPTNSNIEYGSFYKTLCFLIDLYGIHPVKQKFKRMQEDIFKTRADFNKLSLHLLAGLGTQTNDIISAKYQGYEYRITFNEHLKYPVFINLKIKEEKPIVAPQGTARKAELSKTDFVQLTQITLDKITLVK